MIRNAKRNRDGMVLCAVVAGVVAGAGGLANGQTQVQPVPKFEDPVIFPAEVGSPYGIASLDFLDASGQPGQDGFPEIAVAGSGVYLVDGCGDDPADHRIKIFHNTGTWDTNPAGALVEKQLLDDIGEFKLATELAFADVTGENGPDLVLLGYSPIFGEGYLWVYANKGDGFFEATPEEFTVTGVTLRGLVTADIDGDGDIDVAAAGSNCLGGGDDVFIVFENTTTFGAPSFDIQSEPLGIGNGTAPGDIVVGDFYEFSPGVPFPDLVTANSLDPSYTKVRNTGGLQFVPTTVGAGCAPAWSFITAAAAKFGTDSRWDFAGVDDDDLYLGIFKGDGLGGFTSFCDDPALGYSLYPPPEHTILRAHGIDSGNINGGPGTDLVVALHVVAVAENDDGPEWPSAVAVLVGFADGTFQVPSAQRAYIFRTDNVAGLGGGGSALVELVDLDADGFDDIVVTNNYEESSGGYNISVLINKSIVVIEP
ncbi:MAG: FG-GAP-like repeat-containing protein [Planctomycetota bacterium]|nr:FG-GAP-like repeat-containing protein [Planctomycetota bacterium]